MYFNYVDAPSNDQLIAIKYALANICSVVHICMFNIRVYLLQHIRIRQGYTPHSIINEQHAQIKKIY